MIRLLTVPPLAIAHAWCLAALWIDGPESRGLAGAIIVAYVGLVIAAAIRVRPFGLSALASAVLFLGVALWWSAIPPSNDREWIADVAQLPQATLDGDHLVVRNVRNFHYRSETDFDERWEERSYDLSKLVGADMFFSHWGSPHIAHTITSWAFADGKHLAISIETRKEQGESYSAVLGFFRQFELYYVVGDERDLVGLRAAHRGEDVYLYRTQVDPDRARAILLEYLDNINDLVTEPRWYNALTHNCTTQIRRHVQQVAPGNPLHWKILANGHLPELGYERGRIDTSLPFEELKRRSNITETARAAYEAPGFSSRIRVGLPGM